MVTTDMRCYVRFVATSPSCKNILSQILGVFLVTNVDDYIWDFVLLNLIIIMMWIYRQNTVA